MNVCHTKEQMIEFLDLAAKVSKRISGGRIRVHARNERDRVRRCRHEWRGG